MWVGVITLKIFNYFLSNIIKMISKACHQSWNFGDVKILYFIGNDHFRNFNTLCFRGIDNLRVNSLKWSLHSDMHL